MEYAKEKIFEVNAHAERDNLNQISERWTGKILGVVKRHKFMTTVVSAFFIFSILNMMMIWSFFNILQNL